MVWIPGDKRQKVIVIYKEINQAGPEEPVTRRDRRRQQQKMQEVKRNRDH